MGVALDAPAADFYEGKQIRLIVSTPPSGAYDTYARLIAPTLAENIPGRPTIFVQNMGGAAGIQAANYLANAAPKDGTVIGAVQNNIPTAPLLSPEIAKFSIADFAWIGSITSDPFVAYVWHESKLQTYEQAKTEEFIVGAPAARSYSAQMAQVSNELFGTKFKLVLGYSGSDEVKLAMERGEIGGTFGNAWSSLKVQAPTWISEKKVRIITQFGFKPHPELLGVPMFIDQAKTQEDRELLELLQVPQEFARPLLTPAGIPEERLTILRKAFDDTLKGPKFLDALKKANLDLFNPLNGEELTAMVTKVSKTPPAVIKRTKDILDRILINKRG